MKTQKRKATKKQKIFAILGLFAVALALILFITIGIPMIRDYKNSAYNSKYEYDGLSLVGKWQESESFNDEWYSIREFLPNGKVITTYYVYGIEAIRDELSTYRVDGKNTLVITYQVNNVIDNSETKFSISDDKSTLVLRDGADHIVLKKCSLEYNQDEEIFGDWVEIGNEKNTYTFSNDYTGTISDSSVTNQLCYSTKGKSLYLFINENLPIENYSLSAEFVTECPYKIENDILTITIGDVSHSYERKK